MSQDFRHETTIVKWVICDFAVVSCCSSKYTLFDETLRNDDPKKYPIITLAGTTTRSSHSSLTFLEKFLIFHQES